MKRTTLHGLVGIFSVVGAVILVVFVVGLALATTAIAYVALVVCGLLIYGVKTLQWAVLRATKPQLYHPPDLNMMRVGLLCAAIGTLGVWYVTR